MIETQAGVSPSNTESLPGDLSLADAAVGGIEGSGEQDDPADPAEPAASNWRALGHWSARPGSSGVAMTGPNGG